MKYYNDYNVHFCLRPLSFRSPQVTQYSVALTDKSCPTWIAYIGLVGFSFFFGGGGGGRGGGWRVDGIVECQSTISTENSQETILCCPMLKNDNEIQHFSHDQTTKYNYILKLLMVQIFRNYFVPILLEKPITILKCLFPVEHSIKETG